MVPIWCFFITLESNETPNNYWTTAWNILENSDRDKQGPTQQRHIAHLNLNNAPWLEDIFFSCLVTSANTVTANVWFSDRKVQTCLFLYVCKMNIYSPIGWSRDHGQITSGHGKNLLIAECRPFLMQLHYFAKSTKLRFTSLNCHNA